MRSFFYRHKVMSIIFLMLVVGYYFSLPAKLFHDPTATLIVSREGQLLGAKIARDMQWRFPERDNVPPKFKACITTYEDAYFYRHWGFNPVSMLKAFRKNWKAGKIVRGGSTLTQQVIRLSRKNKARTYGEKIMELLLATRLEFRFSKDKILALYASHAPFGGNVIGIDAAAWRYFGQKPEQLSWAETATLAVLPNAPGLIHINRNREALRKKRDFLLHKLYQNKQIDSLTYSLAVQEALPGRTYTLPQQSPHLLERLIKQYEGKSIQTSIDAGLQREVNRIVKRHYEQLKQNHIYNMAVLVVDISTRKIRAYVGNTPTDKAHQKDVDIVGKPRSTGSILKPFLYTTMLSSGTILPRTLVADIPIQISGYKPENFNLQYSGAVPAGKAIAKSLNIPAVMMLQKYGVTPFYEDLQNLRLTDINKGADYYGLSLILGGAESNLWDLTRAYASLSGTLNHYDETQGKYYKKELTELSYLAKENPDFGETTTEYPLYDAGSIYTCMNVLKDLNRPEGEQNWEFYNDAKPVAWKTGTSFGFRDAWAIGVNAQYAVGVWVGNADGEGRPGLTGITAAAPVLFDVFNRLPESPWFTPPYDELQKIAVCRQSGYRYSVYCTDIDSIWVPRQGLTTPACPYHHLVHLDKDEVFQVNSSCESIAEMHHKSWFVLPPTQAYYYRKSHPFYKVLPKFRTDCVSKTQHLMEFIGDLHTVFLPKGFNEKKNPLVIKLKHLRNEAIVFWYLDGLFIQQTQGIHEVSIIPQKGTHRILAVDNNGNEIMKNFEIL